MNQSEPHDYPYKNPEYQDVVSRVEALFLETDAQTFKILHAIANLALQVETD